MDKKYRLRKNSEFRYVYDRGKSFANKYIIINFNYTTYYEQYYMIDSKKSNSGEIFDPEIIHIHGIREPIFGVDINDKKYRDNLLEFTKTFKVMYSDEFVQEYLDEKDKWETTRRLLNIK